jgi:hypothetical protein
MFKNLSAQQGFHPHRFGFSKNAITPGQVIRLLTVATSSGILRKGKASSIAISMIEIHR